MTRLDDAIAESKAILEVVTEELEDKALRAAGAAFLLKEEEREHIKTYPDMASGGPRVPGANTYGDVDDNIPGLSMTHYYAWRHDFIELRKKWARAEVPSPARLFCPECTHRTFLASRRTPLAHRCGCRADSPSPSRQALADAWHDAEFLVRHAQWQLGALHAIKDSPPDERLAVLTDWLSREPAKVCHLGSQTPLYAGVPNQHWSAACLSPRVRPSLATLV